MVSAPDKPGSNKPLDIAEIMCRSLQIAQEAMKNNIAVTSDLATAKIALQIQKDESLVYGNMFITLYSFHIEMVYFKAFGKVISESGGPFLKYYEVIFVRITLQ